MIKKVTSFILVNTLASALVFCTWIAAAQASTRNQSENLETQDLLVKFTGGTLRNSPVLQSLTPDKAKVEILSDNWAHIKTTKSKSQSVMTALNEDPNVEYIQPNYPIHLYENYKIQNIEKYPGLVRELTKQPKPKAIQDNPPIPSVPTEGTGADPLFDSQWGMKDIGVQDAWKVTTGSPSMIVAVIDTGVDYTHEDLLPNMWRNPGETGLDSQGRNKETNAIDDDGNGFVDDVVGWDFASNDNKPYDLTTPWQDLLKGEGNPGHGTHCAGNVAAKGGNGIGISGVAPDVKIMALRFITEKGSGTTAEAVKAIKYAVDNGAKVLSNSWGSEGEDPNDGAQNQALRDIIQYAQDHGVLFIAAAGNGHKGAGYDNDSDSAPSYPASYTNENIISVAAVDSDNSLAGFSNWGAKTVDIGAPGVAIFSTMVGNKYSDKVLSVGGYDVTWDGTSMATPHVAGAAALYWSAHPEKKWSDVKNALLASAKKIPALAGKVVSEGKLDVKELLAH